MTIFTEDEIRQIAEARIAEESSSCRRENRQFTETDLLKAVRSQHDGDAWLFAQLWRDKLCYDHAAGTWHLWAGHHWSEDRTEEAIIAADAVSGAYAAEASRLASVAVAAAQAGNDGARREAEQKRADYLRKISLLQKMQWKRSVLELAAAGTRALGISGDEWDREPWLLACANGVIDLREPSHFRPGKPGDYIKTASPAVWKGMNEPAPTWELFLRDIFDNDLNMVSFVQRLLGCAIVGQSTAHILPIFWGQGRNGKGTLLETLAHVLGPMAGPIQAEMLLDQGRLKSSAGPSPDIMSLRGRRIVWGSETDEGKKLNAGKIKWLCGGDTLVGREPYGRREVTFQPSHTLFLLTNHKPRVDASDYAVWQRILLVPFNLSFIDEPTKPNERRRDLNLPNRLQAEASGILAWLVRGCLLWQMEGLDPPRPVKQANSAYRESEDVIGQFLADKCVENPNVEAKAGELYTAFHQWAEQMGHKPHSGRKFGEEMKNRFDSYRDRRGVFYIGIGLNVTDR